MRTAIPGSPLTANRPDRGRSRGGGAAALLVALALATVLGGFEPARAGTTGADPGRPLLWSPCAKERGFQCTTVRVPLDYEHPGGPTIPLAVIRVPPAPGASSGVLLLNPGGPGESGLQILPVLKSLLPPAVTAHFDLVSFDERGTGASDRLACGPSAARVASVRPVPSRPGQALPGAPVFTALAADCARRYGAALAEENTTNAARDMDRIRAALGAPQINYYGLSYGTVLGAVYASLFPRRVRAMVLDGAVEATLSLGRQAAEEAPAIQASLRHLFATCRPSSSCPLGADPAAFYDRLQARLERDPLPAPGSGDDLPVTVGDLWLATLYDLTAPRFAAGFEPALLAAAAGQGAPLRALSLQLEEDLDGSSLVGPMWALTCEDSSRHLSAGAAGALARALDARYPLDGAMAVTYVAGGCVAWPPAAHPVTAVHDSSGVPALVVGNTGDPNTPHQAAVQLARSLGRADLLTWRGWGHTWLLNGSSDPCMARAVDRFLISLALPRRDATCA